MTTVVVPWRPAPDRVLIWADLRQRWEALGYQVIEGACPDGPWSKGAAVADGMSRAEGVVVVADADVWCDGTDEAVAAVEAGAKWAVPHFRVLRWGGHGRALAEPPYPGRIGGGLVVLTRATYDRVPMDPRFHGWGQEDEAWGLALRTMLGKPWRGYADLNHYWHEPAPRDSRAVGSDESAALYRRYAAASRNPALMRELLEEVRRG